MATATRHLPVTPLDGARPAPWLAPADDAAARAALRAQIARLEAELSAQLAARPLAARSFAQTLETAPSEARAPSALRARPRTASPRLLTLGDLELERDRLADQLREERTRQAEDADRHEAARTLREEILLDPEAHRHVRVSNADVGEPGCLEWHVRPRFGVLGMLMRWWRVRISSGCP